MPNNINNVSIPPDLIQHAVLYDGSSWNGIHDHSFLGMPKIASNNFDIYTTEIKQRDGELLKKFQALELQCQLNPIQTGLSDGFIDIISLQEGSYLIYLDKDKNVIFSQATVEMIETLKTIMNDLDAFEDIEAPEIHLAIITQK